MSNYKSLKQELITYLKARTPFIVIDTTERERIERLLFEISSENKIDIDFYSDSKQVYRPNSLGGSIDAQNDPINYALTQFKKSKYMTFAILDINHISNDNSYSRDVLNTLYIGRENNCTLIAVTGDKVWLRLINLGLVTTLDYPDDEERTNLIKDFIRKYKNRYQIDLNEQDILLASTILRGFSEMQIENILSAEIAIRGGLFKQYIYHLTEQKNRLYGSIPNVEYINVDPSLKVSGLENLKKWLDNKKQIFFASPTVLKKYDLTSPKGILLAGVPGCGKSLSAKMVSVNWQLPLFKFNLDTIYDKWVGESERKMDEALKFIDNIAPCVLWVDEIEKALSTSEGSNDTGKRVISQFLFWLQESRSRVFLIATANDISLLPPELFRKGRFSEIFFIDLPNKKERHDVILYYLNTSLHYIINETELNELIRLSEGYSYADIETAIKEATQMLIINPNIVVTFNDIVEKFRTIVPISKSNPEIIEKCRQWGNKRACLASLESE